MITVVGESLVDLVRPASGEARALAGGSPANVAVGLARLGAPVSLVTRYGRDEYGALLARHLTGNGVAILGDVESGHPTSIAEAVLDADGVATYAFRIVWDLGEGWADPSLAEGSVCLHTGSIASVLEPGAAAVRRMMTRARGQATVSFDPNCRPSLMGDVGQARGKVEDLVALCDVVKVSDADLEWLYADRPDADVGTAWLGLGPSLVVVTRGAEGSWACTATTTVARPSLRVEVADTVGAGDAFMSGLLDGLRRRDLLGATNADRLAGLAPDALSAVLDEAAVVAAITCSRPGADPPTAAEVAAWR